jgi:gamma-glutamyltranspeptidase / glutathione hydrolase
VVFTPAPAFRTRPELQGTFGMAASTHWLATAVATAVLERDGNAFDAAVAAAFTLHVVEPHLNGPGGDLVALIATADDPTPRVVAGQGPAPSAATIAHYRAAGFTEMPGAGVLATAVPGAVPAWLALLEEHGTWELADVLAFAIGYAQHGQPVLAATVATIDRVRDLFEQHWPDSAAQWLPGGRLPEPGDLVRNEPWARTLERLIAAGEDAGAREERIRAARDAWSSGFVAEEIERAIAIPTRHSSGTDAAGILTASDMAAFQPATEDAVILPFRGVEIAKAGAWSSGPTLLLALAILDTFPDDRLDPSTEAGVHTIAEALKLALADRDAYFGDPAAVPIAAFLDPEYARTRAALIGDTASAEFRPGRPGDAEPWWPPLLGPTGATLVGTGEPTVDRSGATRGDTCHLDVVDRHGNIVSATPSGGWLQSSPYLPELGFCLGSRLQMAWLDPASPSALAPGRRPRTTLAPTLVLRDGRPVEALGTPGGDQQDQWQLPYLLRRIVGGYDPQAAIDAPTFHTTSHVSSFEPRIVEPAGLVVEDRLGDDVIRGLEARGHVVTRAGDWTLGRLSAVGIDAARGILYAAANPRGAQGYAGGR